MTLIFAIAVALAGFLALAYAGARLPVWTAAVALYLLGLWVVGAASGAAVALAALVLAPVALLFNLPALRRRVITRPLFQAFKRVLPPMTTTEREALEAGDTWWEGELFQGRPDWQRLRETPVTRLSDEEQAFLDNQVATLCRMLDNDRIEREAHDLPAEVWDFIRRERFFSLIIPRQYGGRAFSSYAQSCVVTRIATRNISAAVTVMVPNSLGPGELLMQYGTQAQKDYWLPRLADGREIPCFALTGPDVGSDAAAMPDYGVVCRGEHEGREVLGIRLSFSKRYITLAPVATVLGLAFKLHDPDGLLGGERDCGITCALVPTDHPGVQVGERHFPMGMAFMNGPVQGEDVFIPLDWIIGGPEMAGRGWRMLMECLSVGRAISLPALGTAAGHMSARMTGAYARIRRQFKLPIGKFEGVQAAMARIGGYAYRLEAARRLTASAGDLGVKPSVVSAIAKYHMTEMMRTSLNDAMDVHGGRGIIFGPRNYLGYGYQAIPVGITVEGANILTRNLMIFGQGAIRCHPYVFPEMEAARKDDLAGFDRLLFSHIGYSLNRGVRAFVLGLTGARLGDSPVKGATAPYYRELSRMSAALAFVSDVAMGVLGGDLKRRERLSARLGDVLSHLYLASAVLKFHEDAGSPEAERPFLRWALDDSLNAIYEAFDGFLRNFPNRLLAGVLRRVIFPLGRPYHPAADRDGQRVAEALMEPGGVRERVTAIGYWAEDDRDDPMGRMEVALRTLVAVEPLYNRFQKWVAKGEAQGFSFAERIADARGKGLITAAEAEQLQAWEHLRYDCIITDAFPPEAISPAAPAGRSGAAHWRRQATG
ncbi:acyl-CoA dehydrogenase [Alkalilimnicola ehrlichii MLHE-1]|uniref:Acyl-coenzyme A dehydrogenase n=1 Tax=Alkalilimnicola ehrlichii (strain ATCC BAA-1101 / DSM 17681 / MLHE-1) TaxID=187272 RepID=Q0A6S1_ALKEH|nr:acyl-CoA dehydrogenase [Alkalilimnicola ehrlichii]ABI57466.1 acyl-CoA dehydrogenase domain protein [Alkalilimnicola ehrlichii MLHE-1]